MSEQVQQKIRERCRQPDFQQELVRFLVDMCEVDTTPKPDVTIMRDRERVVFDQIRTYLGSQRYLFEDRAITPKIAEHPAYSLLHFTKTAENPKGLSPEETYKERTNLLATVDAQSNGGRGVAVNAHIDVIAPFIPPRQEGDTLYGRGVIDDKGNVAAICAALKIIDELIADGSITLKGPITAMFPIEEETGGNGSLALSLDRELKKRYDTMLVMECADMGVYPANRGAVWFRCELQRKNDAADLSLIEAMAWGVLAMQEEGAQIKSESSHPLFPHRPVQTCNGILGPFGEHPSRINGRVETIIRGDNIGAAFDRIQAVIDKGVAVHIERHGDKTQSLNPATGKPKVARHVDVERVDDQSIHLTVHGSTGHMGSILENDDAILKWAYIVRELVEHKRGGKERFTLELPGTDTTRSLVLEGGQGFLPTHPIETVQDRMAGAFAKGAGDYVQSCNAPRDAVTARTTYEKLHNAAYSGDPDAPSVKNALWAAHTAKTVSPDTPLRGWDVSCDARLFASEYPDLPVITSGVGALACAHSNDEHLKLEDLWKTVEFCSLYLLRESGSI